MPKKKTKNKTRNKTFATYKNILKELIDNKTVIKGYKYDREVADTIQEGEFVPLYRPKIRPYCDFKQYYFVSKEGYLLSLSNINEPIFVKVNLKSDRPLYTIMLKNGKNKKLTPYALTGLAYDSYIEKDALNLLRHEGAKILGANKTKNGRVISKVQAHHTLNEVYSCHTEEDFIKFNNPKYIEFITNKAHYIVGNIKNDIKHDLKVISTDKYDAPDDNTKAYTYETYNEKTGERTTERKVYDISDVEIAEITSIIIQYPRKHKEKIGDKTYYFYSVPPYMDFRFNSYDDREQFLSILKKSDENEDKKVLITLIKCAMDCKENVCSIIINGLEVFCTKHNQYSLKII